MKGVEFYVDAMISLEPLGGFEEMHLIETAPHNFGRKKKYNGVPGNLVAFACKMSFEMGFGGFVAFMPKTSLVQHYIDTLGAEIIYRNRVQISEKNAEKLVNSYFKDYFK